MAIRTEILINAHRALAESNLSQLESAKRLLATLDDEEKKFGFVDHPRKSESVTAPKATSESRQTLQAAQPTDNHSSLDLLIDPDQSMTLTLSGFVKMRRQELSTEALTRGERRVSQETLSRKANISLAWYQKIEQGTAPRVGFHLLSSLATAMGLDETYKLIFLRRFGPEI